MDMVPFGSFLMGVYTVCLCLVYELARRVACACIVGLELHLLVLLPDTVFMHRLLRNTRQSLTSKFSYLSQRNTRRNPHYRNRSTTSDLFSYPKRTISFIVTLQATFKDTRSQTSPVSFSGLRDEPLQDGG